MPVSRSLSNESIELHAQLSDSDAVLHRVAELASRNALAGSIGTDTLYEALSDRERLGSTGLGRGIAIPHCTIDDLEDFVVGVLVTDAPVEFDSVDGQPVDLFFFIVGPTEQRNRHIKLLSAISKVASQADRTRQLREADEPQRVRELLIGWLGADEEPEGSEKVLFQVFLQNLDVFEDVLNLLSSVVPGSISVLETRSAGAYLFSLPLFAAFWTDKASQDGRVILAIADRGMTNSLIRQIQEITGDPEQQTGVVVTVQELSYAAGSLDF